MQKIRTIKDESLCLWDAFPKQGLSYAFSVVPESRYPLVGYRSIKGNANFVQKRQNDTRTLRSGIGLSNWRLANSS